jgi:Flp pilus assembly protein TadB
MQPAQPTSSVAVAITVAVWSIALVAWTPPFVSILLALIAATGWCIWLERHPPA